MRWETIRWHERAKAFEHIPIRFNPTPPALELNVRAKFMLALVRLKVSTRGCLSALLIEPSSRRKFNFNCLRITSSITVSVLVKFDMITTLSVGSFSRIWSIISRKTMSFPDPSQSNVFSLCVDSRSFGCVHILRSFIRAGSTSWEDSPIPVFPCELWNVEIILYRLRCCCVGRQKSKNVWRGGKSLFNTSFWRRRSMRDWRILSNVRRLSSPFRIWSEVHVLCLFEIAVMGRSYSLRNVATSPRKPGQTKLTIVYMSPRLFWMGVAVIQSLASHGKDSRAVMVSDPEVFLSRCPSSTTRSATLCTLSKISAFIRNKS